MGNYTFNPPDVELMNNYLNNKIIGREELVESEIDEVNICRHEPPDLPGLAKIPSTDTWYFFSPAEKLGRSNRRRRATMTGHWKITGKSCLIKDSDAVPIGQKKFLVFQENNASSSNTLRRKTTWIIHEFHSFLQHPNKDTYVLCKLIKKPTRRRSCDNASHLGIEPSVSVHSDFVLTQSQSANRMQEPPSNLVLQDNGSGVGYDYNFEEHPPEFHYSVNWLLGESCLQQPEFHYLQPQRFTNTTDPWDGGVSNDRLADQITVSEINYHQIPKIPEFANGSCYSNMHELCYVYKQNAIDIAKTWERGESSCLENSDTVSEINNQIQETAKFENSYYCNNVSQLGYMCGQYTIDIAESWEQGESNNMMHSDIALEANNYQIQKTSELVADTSCDLNMPQFGHVYRQNTGDLPKERTSK